MTMTLDPAFDGAARTQSRKDHTETDSSAPAAASRPESAAPKTRRNWRLAEEPWPIWAAIMVFLNIFVIAGMVWGAAGIVTVMVPAALLMLGLLTLIVFG